MKHCSAHASRCFTLVKRYHLVLFRVSVYARRWSALDFWKIPTSESLHSAMHDYSSCTWVMIIILLIACVQKNGNSQYKLRMRHKIGDRAKAWHIVRKVKLILKTNTSFAQLLIGKRLEWIYFYGSINRSINWIIKQK